MMATIQSYVRQGKHTLRRWAVDPRIHMALRITLHILCGFCLGAASIGNAPMPFAMGLVCACTGWSAVLVALGGAGGYLLFWGSAGQQGLLWLAGGLAAALLLGRRAEKTPLLLPALGALLVSAAGVAFQTFATDNTSIPIYLLRVALGAGATGLFTQVLRGRNPILEWLVCGVAVLALAQIVPLPSLGLGFLAAGALTVAGAFPAAAIGGLALDIAQVTPVPMAAVLCLAYLVRLLPKYTRWLCCIAPGMAYLGIMAVSGHWDVTPLPGLLLGAIGGSFLPVPGKVAHRRGETGAAQVRLEMAAGVLAQTQQLLLEAPPVPVDEEALIARAAERACGSCPCRKTCKDTPRLAQSPVPVLHKPLLTAEELPIACRKSGRFLAELHRSQEQLRSIRADRQRQAEYRAAVVQQYQFLASYLQELSDQLARRLDTGTQAYVPAVSVFGNRPEPDNGDRCMRFAGTGCRYYVLLCDGMGTGLGAVQEARLAGQLLRRLLCAGYPAEYALRTLNSICALRDRAGAVTVDLAELSLDTGKGTLYKWGAAPSYLVNRLGAEKIGTASPPPGLSVTEDREQTERLSLRRGELLVLVSDGVEEAGALQCCMEGTELSPAELAKRILACGQLGGQDDATVVTLGLKTLPNVKADS